MPQALTIISILLILSALLGVYLAAWARLHSRVPAASDFFWLFLCVALYSAGYAVEISHSDLSSILIAIRLEYFGLAFVAPMLLLFALHFVRGCAVPPSLYAAILFIPSITLIIVLTIESHDLFYVNPRIDTTGYLWHSQERLTGRQKDPLRYNWCRQTANHRGGSRWSIARLSDGRGSAKQGSCIR
jgi:lysylphosphatidylglycerol synthetase-like protein (DUF2156 family)